MTRRIWIERCLRQIYNGQPADDATITENLVNTWLNDGVAIAAKANYKDNIAIEGIGFVNNSFYTTFKGIAITFDELFTWKAILPEIPLGIGRNEGISTLQLKDNQGNITRPFIPISQSQKSYYAGMKQIPNKVLYYYEGQYVYIISAIQLSDYTISVTMISGGDSTDLDSTLNVPSDYFPVMVSYIQQQLMMERMQPTDTANDGMDVVKNM